ncbi:MAG: zinc metallopeptidase [Clostridia bacterium]|nr:zinc metallopeptidase [Clostridia bacterium]
MYFNYGYLLFMLPALIFGIIAQVMVKLSYSKYSKISSKRGLTGMQAAQEVLKANGVSGVTIVPVSGELTDHYDPKTNEIRLSQGVYGSASIAAVGVACHEAGHAVQYAKQYAPIKLRAAVIPVCRVGSFLGPLLVIAGFFISYAAENVGPEIGNALYLSGIILFATVALFHLITLPVELDASNRAIKSISASGTLDSEEVGGAKKVLTAAALTYVAALATSILQIVYYASRFRPRSR